MKVQIAQNLAFDSTEYLSINQDLCNLDENEAAKHFFCVGISEMRKFSRRVSFDSEFYRNYYNDIMFYSSEEAYDHWIRKGSREGLHPNGSALMKTKGIKIEKFPDNFFTEAYAQALGVNSRNKWYCLEHFIQTGFCDVIFLTAAQAGTDLLKQIAESFIPSNHEKALQFLELASTQDTSGPDVFHTLGDVNLHLGRYYNARLAYKEALARGSVYFWTLANLAVSCEKLGLYDESIKYAKHACIVQQSSYAAKDHLHSYAKKNFYLGLNAATGLSVGLRDIDASITIKDSISSYFDDTGLSVVSSVKSLPKTEKSSRIAIFGSDYIFQCKLYRIDQKIEQLRSVNKPIDYYSLDMAGDLINKIYLYDSIIVYRAPALPDIMNVLKRAKRYNVVTFYDIDDLIFDAECYPPSRESFGTMITADEYAGLVTGREMFRAAIELCDFGIASTPLIQREMENLVSSGICYLHRNGLGKAHTQISSGFNYNFGLTTEKKEVVFFYGSGSRSHNENFAMISEPLSKILKENNVYKLIIYGPLELDSNFHGLEKQIKFIEFSRNIEDYWEVLESSDINLAPLTNTKFNDAKSEIKWMEAGMLGVPSIVSATEVYRKIINNKEDGLVVNDKSEWFTSLKTLAEDEELRIKIAQSARKRVYQEYNLQTMGASLLEILNSKYIPISTNQKKRILIVNVYYPPQFIGGATRVVESNVSFINRNYSDEFEVEVFCARDSGGNEGSFERYEWNNVVVNSLSPFHDRENNESSVKTEIFFNEFVSKFKPDLIHFHCIQRLTASVVDVARRKSIPYVVTVHDGWWISDRQFLIDEVGVPVYETGEWGDYKRLSRLRNSLNRARSIIAVSEKFGDLYKSRGIKNVTVCTNGASIIADVAIQPQSGPIVLGLLGGLGLAKGANLLYDALSVHKFSNLKFIVVDHAALEGTSRVEYWGENEIEIVGKTNFNNVSYIYSKIHFLLAISICVESFGLVAREASLLGRWVIASDRGGIGEDIQDGVNGFILDVSSVTPLLRVLENRS